MRKVLFLFGVLDDRDIEWMISAGRVRRIRAGEVLIEQGREIDAFYVVLNGTLAVKVRGAAEREIARLQAGEVVGEMSFVDSRPPSATVTSLQDSRVLAIQRSDLRRQLGDTGFAARFYQALALLLADRLRATSSSLGYGRSEPLEACAAEAAEIDPLVLERVGIAGVRFDHMLRRLVNQ